MVTLSTIRIPGGNRNVLEIVGLSTDTKPVDEIEGIKITNGSTYFCIDNSDVYMFDETNKTWHKL